MAVLTLRDENGDVVQATLRAYGDSGRVQFVVKQIDGDRGNLPAGTVVTHPTAYEILGLAAELERIARLAIRTATTTPVDPTY
jgi:hypothetical protein